jgi:hypothetical protein
MTLSPGLYIWLRCDVKPGPFSNERLVRVKCDKTQWVGFVPISSLRDPIEEGTTQVQALVLEVYKNDGFSARVAGDGVTSNVFQGSTGCAELAGAIEA